MKFSVLTSALLTLSVATPLRAAADTHQTHVHGEATLNLDQSTITGILVAPQQPGSVPGFAGGFQLIDQLDNSAAGLFAWPGQINSGLPTSDNPEPQR